MSLTVQYGTRRFKVPVTAGTPLGQVRQHVCSSLKLDEEDYVLLHGAKPLDLTLLFRLSGLVNNAEVELKRAPRNQSSVDAPVRIKIRIPNGRDFVGALSGATTVDEVLAERRLSGELLLNGAPLPGTKPLSALGSGVMLTFRQGAGTVAKNAPRSDAGTQPSSAAAPEESSQQRIASSDAREPKFTNSSRPAAADMEGPPAEPSRVQFMAYYNQLKGQAEPPMISKQTRAQMATQRPAIEITTVKIKFPDQSSLEGKFRAGETGSDVFKFLSLYLARPKQPYELVSIKPSFVLTHDMPLAAQLGQRAMLVFKPLEPVRAPFLNEKAQRLVVVPPKPGQAQPEPASSAPPPSAGPKKSKGIPKWLKLHK